MFILISRLSSTFLFQRYLLYKDLDKKRVIAHPW